MKLNSLGRADFFLFRSECLLELSGLPVKQQHSSVPAVSNPFVLAGRSRAAQLRTVRVEVHSADAANVDFVLDAVGVKQAGIEFPNQLARLRVPVFEATFQVGRHEAFAIGMKRDVINVAVMPEQFVNELPLRVRLPESNGSVVAGGGEQLAVGAGADFSNRPFVSLPGKLRLRCAGSI